MLQRLFIVALLASSWTVACSDDETTGVPQDGGGGTTSSGTGGATTSSGTGGTSSSGGGGSGGSPSCDNDDFVVGDERCIGGGSTTATLYRAFTSAAPPYDVLSLQLWHDQGAPTGAYAFTFAGENYATCSTCGLLGRACVDDLFENCEKIWLIVEGQLDITDNAVNLTGSLTGAQAVEVTIDWGSFTSTVVAGGENWCIASHSFDIAITPP